MRKRLRHLLWSLLWDIGDYCLWKAKQIEPESGKGTIIRLKEPIPTPQFTTQATGSSISWTITNGTWPPPSG